MEIQEIDWSKAPEGATHWAPKVDGEWKAAWHKFEDGYWLGWLDDGADTQWDITIFNASPNHRERISSFIPRP